MKGMLKGPLIIAAVLVVGRVILEQAGAPGSLNNVVSVVIFYVFIAPLYFAFRIANSGIERPYRTLFKNIALFTALARAMVIPTYWLAYYYQWTAPRFSVAMGGNVRAECDAANGLCGNSDSGGNRMDSDFAHCRRRAWFDCDQDETQAVGKGTRDGLGSPLLGQEGWPRHQKR